VDCRNIYVRPVEFILRVVAETNVEAINETVDIVLAGADHEE